MPTEDIKPVNGDVKLSYSIELRGYQGSCQIRYGTNTDIRPKQSQIALYSGAATDPVNHVAVAWADRDGNVAPDTWWDTGQRWGQGWSAAMIAQRWHDKEWDFVVKTPVTA